MAGESSRGNGARLTLHLAGQELRIEIAGHLDDPNLPPVAGPLLAAVRDASGPVTVDLRNVWEVGSGGLSLLLEVHKSLPVGAGPLSVRVTSGSQPERVLILAGFGPLMTPLPGP